MSIMDRVVTYNPHTPYKLMCFSKNRKHENFIGDRNLKT